MKFRQSLIAAAEQAHADGELTRRELFKLRLATLSPRVCDQLEAGCAEQAMSQGALAAGTDVSAIDWTSLLALLKEWLPTILEWLKLLF